MHEGSVSYLLLVTSRVCETYQLFRHIRLPAALRRSGRPRTSCFCLPNSTLHLPRDPPAEGSRVAVSVLSEADRPRDEPSEQQRVILDVRAEPPSRLLQGRLECQLEHG